jgi:ABC-type antimicrobial peptide transport system permease subunit
VAGEVRRIVREELKNVPVARVTTMDDLVDASVVPERVIATLSSFFGGLGVSLAALGLYGLLAYTVTRRTNEIGIRIALGARPSNVVMMIVRQAFTIVGIGEIIGLAGALALTRVLSTFLFGMSAVDPATFSVVMILLAGIGLTASALAARRAANVDPILALRRE